MTGDLGIPPLPRYSFAMLGVDCFSRNCVEYTLNSCSMTGMKMNVPFSLWLFF